MSLGFVEGVDARVGRGAVTVNTRNRMLARRGIALRSLLRRIVKSGLHRNLETRAIIPL